MSDTLKIILIISIFAFFIYKRKISSFLISRKEKRLLKKGTGENALKETSSVVSEDVRNVSSVSAEKDFPCRYEVYAFAYAEFADTNHFADRLRAKLDFSEMSMQNKKHYIKYIELGTLLLILVKYQE